MSGQSTKWREEQILIVCPGSRVTMAQLGCNELTPPAYRIPTRMFRDEETDEWRPYRTWKRKKETVGGKEGGAKAGEAKEGDEWEYVEDPDSDEGAVYPMEGGYITNMEAFLAFLEHVHGLLTTTFHNTPIVLMASPQWSRPDCEAIALYIFEKTRTPALCMIHSALATQYGLKWPHMTVVDIGFEKVDVTCIYDSRIVNHMDVGFPVEASSGRIISGGEAFTQRLMQLLRDKEFTHDMAEQLKKNPICEVLPYAPDLPLLMDLPEDAAAAAAAAAKTAAEGADAAKAAALMEDLPMEDAALPTDNDGVLDVAAIVTTGQTKEFLAKKEKEKSERGRPGRRGKDKDAEAAATRPVRVPNAKRARTVFRYEELIEDDEPEPVADKSGANGQGSRAASVAADATNGKVQHGGSEDGSDGEGSDMEDDDEEDGEGEGEEGEAAAKSEGETEKEEAAKPEEASKEKPAEAAAEKEDATMEDVPPVEKEEAKDGASTEEASKAKEAEKSKEGEAKEAKEAAEAPAEAAAAGESTEVVEQQPGRKFKWVRRDFEIGLERFTFADRVEIDRIVATIYRTVQGIEDMYMRPSCWENLVFVGNGARLRGLRDNILQTLHARYLISPSTATMFTSELPSNMGTPSGTGSQTPTGSFATPLPHQLPSGVNPLLQAATMASMGLSGPGSATGGDGGGHSHHFHAQTPTSIKLAALPSYLSEWSKNGFEEAMFLGAQVAARLAFCVHNLDAHGLESQRLMYLSRIDYNELGPKGIRTHSLLN